MAEESDAKEGSGVEKNEKKKSPGMLIAIIIAAALIIGGGGAVTLMMLKGNGAEDGSGQEVRSGKRKKDLKPSNLGPVVKLDPFIVNLSGSGGRNYLKIDLSLELGNPQMEEEINNKLPKIKDAILLVLSTKTFDDVKTSQGKLVLKYELLMRLNSYLTMGSIENIYFTSFVVQ